MCYAGVSIVRTHRSRCNVCGTTLDIAQAMSQKLRNSQVDRNGDVSSKPETSWFVISNMRFTWDIFGYNDDLWSLSLRFQQIGVIRRMPPFCHRIGGNDVGRVKTLIKLSELHMTCIPNTSQYVNIPQYCKTETRFQYLLIWFWPKLLPSYLPRWSPKQSSTNTAGTVSTLATVVTTTTAAATSTVIPPAPATLNTTSLDMVWSPRLLWSFTQRVSNFWMTSNSLYFIYLHIVGCQAWSKKSTKRKATATHFGSKSA